MSFSGKIKDLRKESRFLFLLGLLGIIFYFSKAEAVFPSASIKLEIPKAEIARQSVSFAQAHNFNCQSTIKSTVFSYDDSAKTFLEYELGQEKANNLMQGTVPVWYWSSRLCRPLALEELSVCLSPGGKLLAFDHSLENDRALPVVSHEAALQMAKAFVEKDASLSLEGYVPVEDGSIKEPNRLDHFFTWENQSLSIAGAHLRIHVHVSGNMVTSFNYYLNIPETWLRKYDKLRSYNQVLEDIAGIFYAALNVGTFFAFLWAFTSGLLRMRFAFLIGIFMALMSFLDQVNSLPSALHAYTTTMSFQGYIMDTYVNALWSAISDGLRVFILTGAAEALYRVFFPHALALEKIFSRAGLRSLKLSTGLLSGIALFGLHLGWVSIYYLAGRKIGLWAPLEIHNADALSATFPFFSSLYIGVSAACLEELSYRVFGLTIFQKLCGRFWLANLLQALAWAFMHSNYAQEPPYARGLELSVIGIFYGLFLRRFGLIATICAHYTFDAFLGVSTLFSSPQISLRLSAYATIVPFALILLFVLIYQIRRGVYENEEEITNLSLARQNVFSESGEILPKLPYFYQHHKRRVRLALSLAVVSFLLIQFAFYFPVVGAGAKVEITRDQAVAIARNYLLKNQIKPEGHYEVASLMPDLPPLEMQYVYQKTNLATAAKLALFPLHPLVWKVRFFRILDPCEYIVYLDGKGMPIGMDLIQSEDAAGARLSQDKARSLVESYFKQEHSALSPLDFEDASEEKRIHRTDWSFTYVLKKYNIAAARFEVSADVIGRIVSDFEERWQLPDRWTFEWHHRSTKDQYADYVMRGAGLLLLAFFIYWIYGLARSGAIRWRPPLLLALACALLVIPQTLNDIPEFFIQYKTATPLTSYLIGQIVRQVLTALSLVSLVAALGAFALASLRLLFPHTHVISILEATLAPKNKDGKISQRHIWLDAILVGYAGGLAWTAMSTLSQAVHALWSPTVTLAPLDSFCKLANLYSPSLDSIMDCLTWGLTFVLLAGVLAGLAAKYFKSFKTYLLFAFLASMIFPITDRFWQDYLIDSAGFLLLFLGVWFFVAKFAKQNLLAYFLAGASIVISTNLRVLFMHGGNASLSEMAILALFLASPLFYLFAMYFRGRLENITAEEPG